MEANLVMPYYHTGVKQRFTAVTLDDGTVVRTYFDDGPIRVRFISKTLGDAILRTDAPLELFERIHSLVDRAGVEFAPGETYYVKSVLPTLNVLGFADGYAYKVARAG